jgi:ABC-type glycerol-3-phosphate transport system substrate-binding protein
MIKRIVFSLFLVFLLTTCRSTASTGDVIMQPDKTANTEVDSITITFACPKSYLAAMETLADEFHVLNPGIYVKVVAIEDLPGFDWYKDPSLPATTYPIVSSADTAMWVVNPQAARAGLYRDLSPFIERDETLMPTDFFPHTLEAYNWRGATYALPTQIALTVMFYNRRAFDEAGLPYPAPDWTLEDFFALAQRLTIREGNSVSQYGFSDRAAIGEDLFIWSRVGNVVDETGKPQLEATKLAEAIQWYADLILKHGVMPAISNLEQLNAQASLVKTGGAAMWTEDPHNYEFYPEDLDIGIAPLPVTIPDGNSHYPGRMFAYLMSAGTSYPQVSWRWLRFLTHHTPPGHCVACLPARRSVAEDTLYWMRFEPEVLSAIQQMAEHLYFSHSTDMLPYVQQAVAQVLNGESVATALREAQIAAEKAEVLLAQATPWVFTVKPLLTTADNQRPQILFATSVGGSTLQELAASFNAQQGNFEVKIVSTKEQAIADCFQGLHSVDFAEVRGELRNLQPLLEADPSFTLADFPNRFLDAYRYQGALWGMPVQAQVRVVYYNRTLFDTLGLTYPEVGWTTANFQNYVLALHQAGYHGYLPLDGEASDLVAWLTLLGGKPWNTEGEPRFDAQDVIAAMTWYAGQLAQQPQGMLHLLMPTMESREARLNLVRKGQIGIWSNYSGMRSNQDFGLNDTSVGIIPLPVGTHTVSDFLYEGLFIAADSAQVEQCWDWIKFMSAHYVPAKGIPARTSIMTSLDFISQVGDETQSTYLTLLDAVDIRTSYDSAIAEQSRYLLEALREVLQGTSPAQALMTAQQLAVTFQKGSD